METLTEALAIEVEGGKTPSLKKGFLS